MMDIRESLARDLLNCAYPELSAQKKSVIDLIADQRPTGVGPELKDQRTYWDRMADKVAQIGGSWAFIAAFGIVLAGWVSLNVVLTFFHNAFDPYPFIFLNLMLSMLAAVQAPVIMMSQNRQAAIDRKAAEHDYVVNLRAELEIMLLHDKLDALREGELLTRLDALAAQVESVRAEVARIAPG
jgi:uncharacterized membrane protein